MVDEGLGSGRGVAGSIGLALGLAAAPACLVSNLPSSARPIGKGRNEFGMTSTISLQVNHNPNANGAFLGTASRVGAAADLAYGRGLTDRLDIGIQAGSSGALTGLAKVVLVNGDRFWLAAYCIGRTYFYVIEASQLHGGAIATMGGGPTRFSVGAFYGTWLNLEVGGGGGTDPRSRYVGGGVGLERTQGGLDLRGMLEVQQFGTGTDSTTGVIGSLYIAPAAR